MSDGAGYMAMVCLGLGLMNANACLSEERSSKFFQVVAVLTIWTNLVVALLTMEVGRAGLDEGGLGWSRLGVGVSFGGAVK